jgi:signal transduction histidine kinase
MGRRDAVCLIEIVDDGCGFDVAAADRSARNGLRNLRERINETGGQLAVLSSPRGTTVRILIPCQSL